MRTSTFAQRILDTIQSRYYWQGLHGDVKNHMKACHVVDYLSYSSPFGTSLPHYLGLYIRPHTKDGRANLTEFMPARMITFISIPENLVGDRGSIFPSVHGRPCTTIKGQMCGTYSLHCLAILQQDDFARQPNSPTIRSINLQPSKLATKSHY